MVLPPLEFSECYLDSPWFRENIQKYEVELERTNTQIKQLIKDAKNMINAFKNQEKTMSVFNSRLQNFQFDCIGENLTENEKLIAGSLKEFGLILEDLSAEWKQTIERAEYQLIIPLERFRKEHIYSFRDSKKLFEKASERYYKQLEHNLSLSHKKKEQQLQESDNELQNLRTNFHAESLQYVYKLQEVQERKKFEFVENLLMFMQVYFNYLHQTHETATDYKEYMKHLQMRLVGSREAYNGTQKHTMSLMTKMKEHPDGTHRRWSRAGYLFLMEKNSISARLASKWTKYFCMYSKENKLFHMMSPHHASSNVISSVGGKTSSLNFNANSGLTEPLTVKTCTRRSTDTIDKRFCFDLELEDQAGRSLAFTLQAVSELDRKKWLTVMDGKEPQYVQNKVFSTKRSYGVLNEQGLNFITNLITEIERRGVEHEGIYRLVGVTSKVDNLIRQALNPNTGVNVDFSNLELVETNTMTSALKSYLRNLPEPLMTFDLHRSFIDAAKCEHHSDRVMRVATLVAKLPNLNRRVLSTLMQHLEKVEAHHEKNKMTVQNLGVCFGPTLLRDLEESVQAIIEIKFSNIIVEILLEEREAVIRDEDKNGDDNEALQNLPSPKIYSKTATRLPSQRLKQRPRGAVFDQITTIPVIDENVIEAHFGENAQQARAILLNNHSETPPSPMLERNQTLRSSQSSDDSLQLPPIDLDLGFDEFTGTINKTPEEGRPVSLVKSDSVDSISEVSKASNPSITSEEVALNPPCAVLNDGDGNRLLPPELNQKPVAPQPKLRISLRRGKRASSKKKPLIESFNQNNSNCNSPVVRPKPRTLAMANSIKGARKKFVSARDGLIGTIGTKKQQTSVYENQWTDFRKPLSPSRSSPHSTRRMRTRHVNSVLESTTPSDSEEKASDTLDCTSPTSPQAKKSINDATLYEDTVPCSSQVMRQPCDISTQISSKTECDKKGSPQTVHETPYENPIPFLKTENDPKQTFQAICQTEKEISFEKEVEKDLPVVRQSSYEIPSRSFKAKDEKNLSSQVLREDPQQTCSETKNLDSSKVIHHTTDENSVWIFAANTVEKNDSSRVTRHSPYEIPMQMVSKTEADKNEPPFETTPPTAYEAPIQRFSEPEIDKFESTMAKTLYACEAEDSSELSFEAGQIIRDIRPSEADGWIYGCLGGQVGLVPINYIEFI